MTLKLFIYQFLRSKEVRISFILILVLGLIGIFIGKRHLVQQQQAVEEVTIHQKDHLSRYVTAHNDDLGLLLYYVKFAFINPSNPLSGLSIGQSDLNPSIKRISIKTLEGQKHDTDLMNPMNLQSGNLDLSFVLIYLFPLLIIVLAYNVLSEETDSGTWSLVAVQSKSKLQFLANKLTVRFFFVLGLVLLLFLLAVVILSLSFTIELILMFLLTSLYIVFWFVLSFFIVLFKNTSRFNALTLLTIWLVLVILVPSGINAYMTSKYPVPEALNTAITQRDGYHTKWDTDKIPTIQKFYAHYPQFEKYGYPTEGFNWLWYYAMQQMGDDDSKMEREAFDKKVASREKATQQIASIVPTMYIQLAFNQLAGTSMNQYIEFLKSTDAFHEKLRLFFYPKIFESDHVEEINWDQFRPEFYSTETKINGKQQMFPLLLSNLLMLLFSIPMMKKL